VAEVVARGIRFHVQRLGRGGRRVVFLHGLVMDNLSSWYFTLANAAAVSADVILYDLRGHGGSERPATGYTVADMLADLDELLVALGVTAPVQLVGNSFGGLLALQFAATFPERTSALALVDPHLNDNGWGERMSATLKLDFEERNRRIGDLFQSWAGRHSERRRTRLVAAAEALAYRTSLAEDLRTSPPMTDDDLRRVRCPVLALYGEHSDVRASGDRLAAMLPACEVRIVPGCTHSVLWEATDVVRRDVIEWLAAQDS
jgi:pimeloyl-ACP methyl ester carboxylesterase